MAKKSKRTKAGWRNANIQDVEEVRNNEEANVVAKSKTDSELFYIDKEGKDTVDNTIVSVTKPKRKKTKPLIVQKTVVLSKKRRRRKKHKQQHHHSTTDTTTVPPPPPPSSSLLSSSYEKLYYDSNTKDIIVDVWGDDDSSQRRAKKPKIPTTATTELKLTDTMDESGASINPLPEDRQALVRKVYEIHQKEEEERRETILFLTGRHPKQVVKTVEPWTDEQVDADIVLPKKRVVRAENRHTRAKRNKKKRRILLELSQKERRKQSEKDRDINRVSVLVKQVIREEKEHRKMREKAKELLEKRGERDPKLSRYKLKDVFPAVALSDEVASGSMRNAPVVGSILKDQFYRIQKRRFIEPREKIVKADDKPRYKLYNKKGWKGDVNQYNP